MSLGEDPIPVKTRKGQDANMYMRGRNIFDAIVHDIESYGFGDATEVLTNPNDCLITLTNHPDNSAPIICALHRMSIWACGGQRDRK